MIESIRNNWVLTIIYSIVLVGMLWYPDFAGYNPARVSFLLPCAGIMYEGTLFHSIGYRLITLLMAAVNGYALISLGVRYLSLGKASVLSLFFYLLIVFSCPQTRLFSTAFPAALLVILGLFALFESGKTKKPFTILFTSSFLVGCACLLNLSAWIAVVSFVAIGITLNRFSGRNIIVFLGGLLLTFCGCLFYRYLFYKDLPLFMQTVANNVHTLQVRLIPPTPATLFMSLTFFYLLGKVLLQWLFYSMGNQSYRYKVFSSILWMLVICTIPISLFSSNLAGFLPIFALPASLLLAYYYSKERITKQMKVEFLVLLLSIALNQVAYFVQ